MGVTQSNEVFARPWGISATVDPNTKEIGGWQVVNILVVGPSKVGKSTVIRQTTGRYPLRNQDQPNIECNSKRFIIDNHYIQAYLWDTLSTVPPEKYKHKDAILVVGDISRATFCAESEYWFNEINTHAPEARKYLLGHKCDRVKLHLEQDIEEFAEKHGALYFRNSIASSIDNMFKDIIVEICDIGRKSRAKSARK